ncbi:MAG: NAD(P)-dependent alcohol dehydrogenase [Polyangiales bacterium]
MRAARMHQYSKPLTLEDVPVPGIRPDEILVRVTAAGMCRTDIQLVDGYFKGYAESSFPVTPGHEVAGVVHAIGGLAAESGRFAEGDQVVVLGPSGDGICRPCQQGNTQLCTHGGWVGFGPYGGYSEFLPVAARSLLKVDKRLAPEGLAPLTDAGLTPYRGIKKLRDAGALGPDRILGVFGVGGLGTYAVQYAKLLGSGATVVAFGRNEDKLKIARDYGADHVIGTRGKSTTDVRSELLRATGSDQLDAVIDCAGAADMIRMGFELLGVSGHYASVGLVGDKIDIPLFPLVSREHTYHGSFWGNYTDLSEVLALAAQGKIRHSVKQIRFEDINENLELLRAGDIVGRAVIRF